MKLKRILLMLVATLCYLWATSQPLNFTPLMKHNGVTGYQWKYGHIDSALTFAPQFSLFNYTPSIRLYSDNYITTLLSAGRNDSLSNWQWGQLNLTSRFNNSLLNTLQIQPHKIYGYDVNGQSYEISNEGIFFKDLDAAYSTHGIKTEGLFFGNKTLRYPTAAATNDTLLTNSTARAANYITGTIAANQILYATGSNTISGSNNYIIDGSGRLLIGNPINDNTNRVQVNGAIKAGNSTQNIVMNASANGGFIDAFLDNAMTTKTGLSINWNGGRIALGQLALIGNYTNTNNFVLIGTSSEPKGLEAWAGAGQNFIFNSATGVEHTIRRGINIVNSGVGTIYQLNNATSNPVDYAFLGAGIESNATGNHTGFFRIFTATAGNITEKLRVNSSGNVIIQNGNLILNTAGNKITIATGTNASVGTATLSSGTIVVNTTAVTSSSQIRLRYRSGIAISTTSSLLIATNIVNNTSFTVTAYQVGTATTNSADNNQIEWEILN